MERDLIREIHELTKLSVSGEIPVSGEPESVERVAIDLENIEFAVKIGHLDEEGFSAINPQSIPKADPNAEALFKSKRTLHVRPEIQSRPAQPEHFHSESIPVVEFTHKPRVSPSYQEGALTPILREKPKS